MTNASTEEREIVTPRGVEEGSLRDREQEAIAEEVAGGSAVVALVAGGAVLLAILGLVNVLPEFMAAIGTIALGAALVLEGIGIGSRWNKLTQIVHDGRSQQPMVSGAASSQILGGAVGAVLGLLALFGVARAELLPIATIVFGLALVLGSPAVEGLERAMGRGEETSSSARQGVFATEGGRLFIGLGAAALGILGVLGAGPVLTLSMVALLVVGAIELLSGSAVAARMGLIAR